MPEELFWKKTPRQLMALVQVHNELNSSSDEDTDEYPTSTSNGTPMYIDQAIPGF